MTPKTGAAITREGVFIESMKRHRTIMGMTQTDVARAMQERGFKFHQPTVQRIEDGRRPLRLDEAYALASVFKTTVDSLSRSDEGHRRYELERVQRDSREISGGILNGLDEWLNSALLMTHHVKNNLRYADQPVPLHRGERSDRIMAGLAILDRMIRWRDRLCDLLDELCSEFELPEKVDYPEDFVDDEPLPDDGVRVGGEESAETEKEIVALLREHKVPPRFRKMSVPELAKVYARPKQPEPRQHG